MIEIKAIVKIYDRIYAFYKFEVVLRDYGEGYVKDNFKARGKCIQQFRQEIDEAMVQIDWVIELNDENKEK